MDLLELEYVSSLFALQSIMCIRGGEMKFCNSVEALTQVELKTSEWGVQILLIFFLHVAMLQTQGEYDETTSEDEKSREGACATVSLSVLILHLPTHVT